VTNADKQELRAQFEQMGAEEVRHKLHVGLIQRLHKKPAAEWLAEKDQESGRRNDASQAEQVKLARLAAREARTANKIATAALAAAVIAIIVSIISLVHSH
jgi:hypothetical protein